MNNPVGFISWAIDVKPKNAMGLIVVQLHVQYTKQPRWPLIGTGHIVVVQCSTFLFISLFCISGQSLESLGTIPLTFDSVLILGKQQTMKYTV